MSDTSDPSRARMSSLCKVCSWRPQESQPRRSQNKDRWKRWLAKPCPCTYVLGQCSGKAPNRRYTGIQVEREINLTSLFRQGLRRRKEKSLLLIYLPCIATRFLRLGLFESSRKHSWNQAAKSWTALVKSCEIIRCIHGQEEEFIKVYVKLFAFMC